MKRTNSNLVKFARTVCERADGYVFGMYGSTFNENWYRSKKNQYPQQFPPQKFTVESYTKLYGRHCCDCSGLIKFFLWTDGNPNAEPKYKASEDFGATGFYKNAKTKGKMSTFPGTPGLLVFKGSGNSMSHVGVYLGNGKIAEAKGHIYGCLISNMNSTWTNWAQCHLIEDDVTPHPQPQPSAAPRTPNVPERGYFRRGDRYPKYDVKALQSCLEYIKPGCLKKWGIDGDVGSESIQAVIDTQKIIGTKADGLWGPKSNAAYRKYVG